MPPDGFSPHSISNQRDKVRQQLSSPTWTVTATAIGVSLDDESSTLPLEDCGRKQLSLSLLGLLVILFPFCPSQQFLKRCPKPTFP